MILTDIFFVSLFFSIVFSFFYFLGYKAKTYYIKEVHERQSSFFLTKTPRLFWYWLFNPLVEFLVKAKVNPSILTITSVFITIIAALFFSIGSIGWGGFILALASTFDLMDGFVARRLNMVSKRGEYLDSCLDRVSDNIILLGIVFFFRDDLLFLALTSIIILSSNCISYFKAKASLFGVKNEAGIMQRPERLWVLCAGAIISHMIYLTFRLLSLETDHAFFFKFAVFLLAIFTLETAITRFVNGYKQISE